MKYLGISTTVLFLLSAILDAVAYSICPGNILFLISAISFGIVGLLHIPETIEDIKEVKQNRKEIKKCPKK